VTRTLTGVACRAQSCAKFVSVGLEHVEGLVLDLPPCAAAGGAVVIGSLSLGVKDLDGEPIDCDGICP